MDRDSRGYALSLDLLLALIPLTLVLGLVAADMDNVMYQMQDVIYRGSTERVAADTMNTLLQTSGDPYNWETLTGSEVKVVGLAKYDDVTKIPHKYWLSPGKLGAVDSSHIQNILGNQYGFNFEVISLNTNITIRNITSLDNTKVNFNNASDIVKVERVVLTSKFDIVAQLENLRGTGQPQTYTSSFPTNIAYNNAYDYWVYMNVPGVSSGYVDINGERVVPTNYFPIEPPLVVEKINPITAQLKNQTELQPNSVSIELRGSPGDFADVYIIQVPKGTPKSEVDPTGADRIRCKVQLYVWPR